MGITKDDREALERWKRHLEQHPADGPAFLDVALRAVAAHDALSELNACLLRKLRRADHEMDRLLDDYNKLAGRKAVEAKPQAPRRTCKGCGCDISRKHPNARFHSKACKDDYWNRVNPRGMYAHLNPDHPQYDPVAAYLDTVHPFSEEAIQG
jgi:hypothetical protein